LTKDKVTLDEVFELCEDKHKDNVIYAKVIFEGDRIRKNFKLMDLENPLMDEDEKLYVETIVEQPVESIKAAEFLKMYNEDGLGHILKNAEYWIRDTFKVLNSFK
jgi:hypothetical protein